MLQDLKQNELDLAEEKLLRLLFGESLEPGPFISFVFNSMGIDPNKEIKRFEDFMKHFMTDSGYVDGSRIRNLLVASKPHLAELIPNRQFRLKDITDELVPVLERILPNVK